MTKRKVILKFPLLHRVEMANWHAIHAVVLLLVAGFALMGVSNLILTQKLEDEMAKNRACSVMQM